MKIFRDISEAEIALRLKNGAVGIIPTDTVYGIVCSAADPVAVQKLYALKHREHKPGTIIAASVDQLVSLGLKRRYLAAVEQFWPGAVSVETPHHIDYLSQSTGRQAVRIPDCAPLLELLKHTGPLQTTSANDPSMPTATTLQEAKAYFGDKVDFYVDGGDLSDNKPSTIVRVIDDAVEVIRQGAVTIE